jgi:hypothetical protein
MIDLMKELEDLQDIALQNSMFKERYGGAGRLICRITREGGDYIFTLCSGESFLIIQNGQNLVLSYLKRLGYDIEFIDEGEWILTVAKKMSENPREILGGEALSFYLDYKKSQSKAEKLFLKKNFLTILQATYN